MTVIWFISILIHHISHHGHTIHEFTAWRQLMWVACQVRCGETHRGIWSWECAIRLSHVYDDIPRQTELVRKLTLDTHHNNYNMLDICSRIAFTLNKLAFWARILSLVHGTRLKYAVKQLVFQFTSSDAYDCSKQDCHLHGQIPIAVKYAFVMP